MTIQTTKGGFCIPPPPSVSGALGFVTGLTIDAADESAAFIVVAPKTGNISKVYWGTRTVTTGATVDVRIETLSRAATPAVPSGTLWGTTTNGLQVVLGTDDNTSFATALTLAAAVTKGDRIAIRINNPTTAFGTMQISSIGDDVDAHLPYSLLNTGASPAVSWAAMTTSTPVLALEYDDATVEVVRGCWPIHSTITQTSIGTGATPDSVGTRFQLTVPAQATGCWVWLDGDGDFVVKLVSTAYHQVNGTGILAQTPTINKEDREAATSGIFWLDFIATADLAANTNYRLLVEGTTATTLAVQDFDVRSFLALDAFWGGAAFHFTTAKDPTGDGDFTNYNSGTFRKFAGGLVLSGFDDAVGGGGGGGGGFKLVGEGGLVG